MKKDKEKEDVLEIDSTIEDEPIDRAVHISKEGISLLGYSVEEVESLKECVLDLHKMVVGTKEARIGFTE